MMHIIQHGQAPKGSTIETVWNADRDEWHLCVHIGLECYDLGFLCRRDLVAAWLHQPEITIDWTAFRAAHPRHT